MLRSAVENAYTITSRVPMCPAVDDDNTNNTYNEFNKTMNVRDL